MLLASRMWNTRWLKNLGIATNLILSLLLAFWLVALMQALMEGKGSTADVFSSIEYSQPALASRSVDIAPIIGLHIFGQGRSTMDHAKPLDKAPDSQAKLILRGIIYSDNSEEVQAIIAKPNGKDIAYHVGASLPGGIRLVQIHQNRVLISRHGHLETLRYQKSSVQGQQVHPKRTR